MWTHIKHTFRLFSTLRTLFAYEVLWSLKMGKLWRWSLRLLTVFTRRTKATSPGEGLAAALIQLGPTFIKLGQALSVRPDIIGPMAEHLTYLQDQLPPFSTEQALETLRTSSLTSLFQSIDPLPAACASIAQVHKAVTSDGRTVAVKILRPRIEAIFARDIRFLRWLAGLLNLFPSARRLRLPEVVTTFEASISNELNLHMEGAASSAVSQAFEGESSLRIPKVDWKRTHQRVLTMEWVDGTRITDITALKKEGHDVDALLQKTLRIFLLQVFREGFFHADMHPGNVLVDKNGHLVLLDFGIMGHLSRTNRRFLAEALLGFLNRDYQRVTQAHFDIGYVTSQRSQEDFQLALRVIGESFFDRSFKEISLGTLLSHLFQTTERFNMPTQPTLLLFQKTLVMVEGILRSLNDRARMWALAQPIIEEWMMADSAPQQRIKRQTRRLSHLIDLVEAKLKPPPPPPPRRSFELFLISSLLGLLFLVLFLHR